MSYIKPELLPTLSIDQMPDGFEDWSNEQFDPVNDAYTSFTLDDLPTEEEVPGITEWIAQFCKDFPDHKEILVLVSY